jgi:hypothetical protein
VPTEGMCVIWSSSCCAGDAVFPWSLHSGEELLSAEHRKYIVSFSALSKPDDFSERFNNPSEELCC